MTAIEVTNSELEAYRACPVLHRFRYIEMMELDRPEDEGSAASFGTWGHLGMRAAWEAARDGARDYSDLYRAAWDAVADAPEELGVREVLRVAVRGQLKALQTHTVLGIEMPFRVRLGGDWYRGQIDLVTEFQGQILVWDHKFTQAMEQFARKAQLDTQSVGYVYALRALGVKANAFRWSIVRRKAPSEPRVLQLKKGEAESLLKNGGPDLTDQVGQPVGYVSSANCDTTPEVYFEALLAQKLRGIPETPEQSQLLERLKEDAGKWYQGEEHYVSDERIAAWKDESLRIISLIKKSEKSGAPYRNHGNCTGAGRSACDFEMPCRQDSPEARSLYRIRTSKHRELAV